MIVAWNSIFLSYTPCLSFTNARLTVRIPRRVFRVVRLLMLPDLVTYIAQLGIGPFDLRDEEAPAPVFERFDEVP